LVRSSSPHYEDQPIGGFFIAIVFLSVVSFVRGGVFVPSKTIPVVVAACIAHLTPYFNWFPFSFENLRCLPLVSQRAAVFPFCFFSPPPIPFLLLFEMTTGQSPQPVDGVGIQLPLLRANGWPCFVQPLLLSIPFFSFPSVLSKRPLSNEYFFPTTPSSPA